MIEQLGINTVHCPIERLEEFGLSRAEVCRGRGDNPENLERKALKEVAQLMERNDCFGIHLPLIVPEWFREDYLSAFYLDPDPVMQKLSWDLLERNLECLSDSGAEYGVIHFCGMYGREQPDCFQSRLTRALEQLAERSAKNGLPLRIEYFGSNENWHHYSQWIRDIGIYTPLSLVVDTGHLFFSSRKHGFDFDAALDKLLSNASSFHSWTALGQGIYGQSESYQKYHHIPMFSGQHPSAGWAFDSDAVMQKLADSGKPVILEGSPIYGGIEYYHKSIHWAADIFAR